MEKKKNGFACEFEFVINKIASLGMLLPKYHQQSKEQTKRWEKNDTKIRSKIKKAEIEVQTKRKCEDADNLRCETCV